MSDTVNHVAGEDQPHYTLVTNNGNNNNNNNYYNKNSTTKTSPRRADVSTLSITGKQTPKNLESLNSSSNPAVPDGQHLLLGSSTSDAPVQPFSPTCRKSRIDTTGDRLPIPVRTASTDKPTMPVLETTRKRAPRRTYKRARADNDDIHALPAPRRSSRRAKAKVDAQLAIKEAPVEAKVPTETDVCRGEHGSVKIDNSHLEEETFVVAGPAERSRADNHDEPSESKRSAKKRKARLKTVPKGLSAASGCRRVNATGRKRKVSA